MPTVPELYLRQKSWSTYKMQYGCVIQHSGMILVRLYCASVVLAYIMEQVCLVFSPTNRRTFYHCMQIIPCSRLGLAIGSNVAKEKMWWSQKQTWCRNSPSDWEVAGLGPQSETSQGHGLWLVDSNRGISNNSCFQHGKINMCVYFTKSPKRHRSSGRIAKLLKGGRSHSGNGLLSGLWLQRPGDI